MSTLEMLRDKAEKMAFKASYEEKCKNGIGHLEISELDIPNTAGFSPLDKIWSSVRKRNYETYGVQTTAIFYIQEDGTIKGVRGEFYPNLAIATSEDEERYFLNLFEETFIPQMELFTNAIYQFLVDYELGYVRYCMYLEQAGEDAKTEECTAIIDAFLRAYGYKTAKDDKEKQKRKTRSKQILAEAKK